MTNFRGWEENSITKGSTIDAVIEYFLNLKGGAEQNVLKKIPRQQIEVVMRSAPINGKINKPISKLNITKNHACFNEISPAGIGK